MTQEQSPGSIALDQQPKGIFCVRSTDGKSAYIDIVDGKLVLRGDLPTDEAAEIFMKAMAECVPSFTERLVLKMQRDELLTELKRMVDVFGRDGHDTEYEEGECFDIDIARGVIARAESSVPSDADGWVSVQDRLPERFLQVLVTVEEDGEKFVEIDAYQVNDWCFPCDGKKVTHWKPLPEPASEQKGGAV